MKPRSSILFVAIALLLGGCALDRNVTLHPDGRTDFVVAKSYRLKQPVFLFKSDRNNFKETASLAELGFGGTAANLDEFRRRSANAPQVAGLLMPGDQIKITKFEEQKAPGLGTFFVVYAVVVSGDNKGTTVRVDLITKEAHPTNHAFTNPEYLEPVD